MLQYTIILVTNDLEQYPQVSRFHPRVLCWVTITIVALAVVFGLSGTNEIRLPEHEQKLGPFAAFCYAAFTSAAWAVVVGWVILVCALGLAGECSGCC